jgi:hypothetical protein
MKDSIILKRKIAEILRSEYGVNALNDPSPFAADRIYKLLLEYENKKRTPTIKDCNKLVNQLHIKAIGIDSKYYGLPDPSDLLKSNEKSLRDIGSAMIEIIREFAVKFQ